MTLKEEIIDLIQELERHWNLKIDKELLLNRFFIDLKKLCGMLDDNDIDFFSEYKERIEELEGREEELDYAISCLEDEINTLEKKK
jgi:hypothetical protein